VHALNAGRVSALVRLVGNKFQEEMVLGTNECKKQLVWANGWNNALDCHLLGRRYKNWWRKTDGIVQSLWCSWHDWRL